MLALRKRQRKGPHRPEQLSDAPDWKRGSNLFNSISAIQDRASPGSKWSESTSLNLRAGTSAHAPRTAPCIHNFPEQRNRMEKMRVAEYLNKKVIGLWESSERTPFKNVPL
jgi:hypothetical protein